MRHPARDEFDALGPAELRDTALALTRSLPEGWALRQRVPGSPAFPAQLVFAFAEAEFVYLPGGACRIGFDAEGWRPSEAERASWAWSVAEWGFDGTIEDHVALVTGRVREIALPPLMCETRATPYGFERLAPDGDEARDVLAATGPNVRESTWCDTIYRFERASDRSRIVWRKAPMEHAALCAALAEDGFRLPSGDEWECVCAGGARTLFPWGDHAPCDRYPIERALAADDPGRDPGFRPGWNSHRAPNRWGVQPPHDPYKPERLAEPDLVRGGDGGAAICGGAGYFLGWLPLAPAWFDTEICRGFVDGGWDDADALSRRVFSLD